MQKMLALLPLNARASCAEGREFESQAGQILHSVANGSSRLQHLQSIAVFGAITRICAVQTCYMLRRNTSSITKDLLFFGVQSTAYSLLCCYCTRSLLALLFNR